MAYYVEIGQCEMYGCHCKVWAEVFAYRNDRMGRYCKKHAAKRVKDLTEAEATNPGGWRADEGRQILEALRVSRAAD